MRGYLIISLKWLSLIGLIFAAWSSFIAVSGANPFEGFYYLGLGAFGGGCEILSTLNKMVPFVLTAFAAAIPAWAGVWNIGAEGQLLLGGFIAAVVGTSHWLKNVPSFVGITIILICAFILGSAWALWTILLRIYMNINEVITTLLSNYIAALLTSYFVNYPFRAPGSPWAQTSYINEKFIISPLISGSEFSSAFFIMTAVVMLIIFMERQTILGYEIYMTGKNELFAAQGGIKTGFIRLVSMIIGGGLAGLAGGLLVVGVNYRFMEGFSPGYGFTGLLITLIANNRSILIIIISFIFAALQTGSVSLELFTDVPAEVSGVLQAILVLFASAWSLLVKTKVKPH